MVRARPVVIALTACLLAACGTPAASPATPTPVVTAAPTATAAPPVLGRQTELFNDRTGKGFGAIRPATIFNGGDPTGEVDSIVWSSWGGPQATGTGTAYYVGPTQTVADAHAEQAAVVAFDLGPCGGVTMYRAVEWYFPAESQTFDATTYEDVCNGKFVGSGR